MEAQPPPPKPEEEKFKKGDYSVHVYIEETKGLMPHEVGGTSNPVISVKCFEKSKCTKELKSVGSGSTSVWNEHLYFSRLNCSVSEISSEKILIEVRDTGLIKKSLIGSYEMDLTHVYYQAKHCLLHQWVILTNPYSEDISVMKGLLKLGINVLHESDKAEDLTQKGNEDSLAVPPQVKLKTVQLVIQFLKAESLPIMDTIGTVDAYCVARFGNVENRTSVIVADKTNMSVYWFEEILLPVIQPSISHKVLISILDKDTTSADDLVGSLGFLWDNVTDEAHTQFMWSNIYGAPPNIEGDDANVMNLNDKLASHWRGRILMRMFTRDDEKPVVKLNKIETPELKKLVHQKFEVENSYQINAQIFEGVNLPEKSADYSVMIRFGNSKLETKAVEAKNNCCKWFETPKRQVCGIPEGALLPDIFVYLKQGDSPVCFARLKAEECSDVNVREKWIKLTPDKVIGKVKNPWEGGYILLRIYMGLLDSSPNLESWKKKIEPPSKITTKKLVCNLYQCRNLPAADSTGLADPYVKVFCGQNLVTTDSKAKSAILNPMWYQQFVMDVSYTTPELAPPIIMQVWDYDMGSTDDLMGYCEVDVRDVPLNPSDYPRPLWRQLSLGTKDTEEGEILASFAMFDLTIPPFILPNTVEVNVEIYALGLRDLKPALGWLPVNKPFLKIDLGAISFPGEAQLINELSTQPSSTGPNPNIGAVLSFKCKIPKDPLFCPTLTCNVYDYLLSGASQPTIGNFSIDLTVAFKKRISVDEIGQSLMKKITIVREEPPVEAKITETSLLIAVKNSKTEVLPEIGNNLPRESFTSMPLSLSEAQEGKALIMPQFTVPDGKRKALEVKFKDSHYLALGYNREPSDGMKHYRYLLEGTLESSNLCGDPPFNSYTIRKGQSRGVAKGLLAFAKKTGGDQEMSTITGCGIFKGLVRLSYNKKKAVNAEEVKEVDDGFEKIARLLLTKSDVLIRIYIVDALDLVQKDSDSASDPYLKIKLGSRKIIDRENYVSDNSCPKFNKHFEMHTTFPGESTLKIQVWDYDKFLPDEKIGTTVIDLEDRFFSETWKSITEQPIETRPLLIKSCRQPQGYLRLWVEIHSLYTQSNVWDISPKPPEKFELRLVIWKSEDVPNEDIEGVSDLYVVADINNTERKETDTHYRAQNGQANWNWRMKFPLLLDENSKLYLNLQLWDRDILSCNDNIGDATLDLTDFAMQGLESGEIVKKYGTSEKLADRLARRENEKFWVEITNRDKDGASIKKGKVLISVELLPEAKALACKNGDGRSDPNVEPFLPKPEGRIKFTLNPITMFNQMIGAELRRKICCGIFCALCLFLFVMTVPMFFSNSISILLFS